MAGRRSTLSRELLKSTPGVVSVEAVPEKEMRQTLEQWLGPAAQSADLPVPALVNFDVQPGTDLTAIEQRVGALAPGAEISAHSDRLGPLLRSMRAMQWLAFGLVLLLGGAAAAAIVLAARGALDTDRFTIEVMHGIGATDVQLTELFQRKIAIDALVGSTGGAVAGAIVILIVASGASFAGELTGIRFGIIDIFFLLIAAGAHDPCDLGRSADGSRSTARDPMITRVASLLLLFYAIGFVLFAFTLGKAAPPMRSRRMRRSF